MLISTLKSSMFFRGARGLGWVVDASPGLTMVNQQKLGPLQADFSLWQKLGSFADGSFGSFGA